MNQPPAYQGTDTPNEDTHLFGKRQGLSLGLASLLQAIVSIVACLVNLLEQFHYDVCGVQVCSDNADQIGYFLVPATVGGAIVVTCLWSFARRRKHLSAWWVPLILTGVVILATFISISAIWAATS